MNDQPPSCRLFVLLARTSSQALILRRGPSKEVALIGWDRRTDTFEEGQWFRGRIYERRSDLSPDGKLFVYFAAKYKEPLHTWTAISRPPYLTALALWPKGDGYGGGGLFEDNRRLQLNHSKYQMALHEDSHLPADFTVTLFEAAGSGEDQPIYHTRLLRDGWLHTQAGKTRQASAEEPVWIEYDPPALYVRHHPRTESLLLTMKIRGIKEENGPWWIVEYDVRTQGGEHHLDLGRTEWADWDTNGDLLYSQQGKLYRHSRAALFDGPAVELADFTHLTFRRKTAPDDYGW